MPIAQQAKLLRVLQTGELSPVGSSKVRKVDARVLSATNVDVVYDEASGIGHQTAPEPADRRGARGPTEARQPQRYAGLRRAPRAPP